eukprot:scaffold5032_cov88-Isochrysis_galbana.AAC.1
MTSGRPGGRRWDTGGGTGRRGGGQGCCTAGGGHGCDTAGRGHGCRRRFNTRHPHWGIPRRPGVSGGERGGGCGCAAGGGGGRRLAWGWLRPSA